MELIYPKIFEQEVEHDYILDCLQLYFSKGVGPKTFYKLIKKYENPKSVINMIDRGRCEMLVTLLPRIEAQDYYNKTIDEGGEIIVFADSYYPENLLNIDDAPPLLFVKGQKQILNNKNLDKNLKRKNVAIVGARNCSLNGGGFAQRLSYELAKAEINIISGMARGVDKASHEGAIKAFIEDQEQAGSTVAVLPSGIDNAFPYECDKLYNDILEQGGAIVSEMPPGTIISGPLFPRRNRIIAGLADGVIVHEASIGSGSLITANLALDYNREVMAVPGAPYDPRCSGSNDLIKNGAGVVTQVSDVLEYLNFNMYQENNGEDSDENRVDDVVCEKKSEMIEKKVTKLSKNELLSQVISEIGTTPTSINDIVLSLDLNISEVLVAITELELEDKIRHETGGRVSRIC